MTERPDPISRRLSAAQRALAQENLHIAKAIARVVARRRPEARDEIQSASFEAYSRAMVDYDHTRGRSVAGFVWRRVLSAAWAAARAPALSPAAEAALDAAEELFDGAGVSEGDAEGFVLGAVGEIGGEHALVCTPLTPEAVDARAALRALSPEDDELVRLHAIEGRSAEEIAKLIGVSKSTIDRRWSALRERLRALLDG